MEKLTIDLQFGLDAEKEVKTKLETRFKTVLTKSPQYHNFDYFGDNNTFYEIKTRRFNKNKYPSTIIPCSKMEFIKQNPNFKYVFIFNFLDGLYYHMYNPNIDYETFADIGGRTDRGKLELNKYIYLPVNFLLRIL